MTLTITKDEYKLISAAFVAFDLVCVNREDYDEALRIQRLHAKLYNQAEAQ